MRNIIDQMFRLPPAVGSADTKKQDLYAKFRILGANVDRIKQLGLATPELEKLIARLQKIHDKKLVQFITKLAQFHPQVPEEPAPLQDRKIVFKNCPRCTRELTEANVIKDNNHSNDFNTFVLVCECGYVRQIMNSKLVARHSLYEYPSIKAENDMSEEMMKIPWVLSVYDAI
jgi:hypothetical protein